jgi:hypothetical protein
MNVRCLVNWWGAGIGHDQMHHCPEADPSMKSKGGIAERRENLLATRDLIHLLYAYRRRRRVFMAMINMEFDHAHYI